MHNQGAGGGAGGPRLGKQSRLDQMRAGLLLAYPPPNRRDQLGSKKPGKVDMATWGDKSMAQRPNAPKGLQFVSTSSLVEYEDFQAFDVKLRRDMMYNMHEQLEEYDEIQKDEAVKMLHEVDRRVEHAKAELRVDVQRVADVDLAEQDAAQQERLQGAKDHLENEIHKVNTDLIDKFMEQSEWNRGALEKIRLQAKSMLKIKSDLMSEQRRQTEVQATLATALRETKAEFAKVLEIVNSVLELEYLSQGLEFQDEIDRHSMSLWAVAPDERKSSKQDGQAIENGRQPYDSSNKSPTAKCSPRPATLAKGPSLQLDEECLSCSLEKYRPMLKAAFKTACITYKPSGVPFNGVQYERTSLINLKRQLIEDLVNQQMAQADYFHTLLETVHGTAATALAGEDAQADSSVTRIHE